MSVSVVPCKGCDSRYAGCHAKCPEYKEWRAEFDRVKKEQNSIRKAHDTRTEAFFRRHKYQPPLPRGE